MKIGYSIIISEIVKATDLDYSDCKEFQVVCPECMEPLYKKVRVHKGESIHHLAHYEMKESNKKCEQRVASYTQDSIFNFNKQARGQTLQKFINYLPTLITNHFNSFDLLPDTQAMMDVTIKSKLKEIETNLPAKSFIRRSAEIFWSKDRAPLNHFIKTGADEKFGLEYSARQNFLDSLLEFFNSETGKIVLLKSLQTFFVMAGCMVHMANQIDKDSLLDNETAEFFHFCYSMTFSKPLKCKLILEKVQRSGKHGFYMYHLAANLIQILMSADAVKNAMSKGHQKIQSAPKLSSDQ